MCTAEAADVSFHDLWRSFTQDTLQQFASLNKNTTDQIQLLQKLDSSIVLILKWCLPNIQYNTEMEINSSLKIYINKINVHIPCGSMQLINIITKEENTTWSIYVHPDFGINITFVRFHLERSSWCQQSYMYVAISYGELPASKSMTYCGTAPPWTKLVSANHVMVSVTLDNCIIYQHKIINLLFTSGLHVYSNSKLNNL